LPPRRFVRCLEYEDEEKIREITVVVKKKTSPLEVECKSTHDISLSSLLTLFSPMPRTSSKRSPSKAGTKRRLVFDVDEEEPQGPSPSASHKRTAVRKTSTAVSAATSAPYGSPVAKRTKQTTLVVVTPDESKGAAAASKSKPAFVPTYIHKNVGYRREGDGILSDVVLRAFDQIVAAHVIPDDLEESRAYGPLSGACYQDRVLQAYTLGRLTVREDFTGATCICTGCAETGHKRDACPTLI
jgi:hypothetical protein